MKILPPKKVDASPLFKKLRIGGLILVVICCVVSVSFSLTHEGTVENGRATEAEIKEPTCISTEVSIVPSDMVKFKLADREYTLGDILITE